MYHFLAIHLLVTSNFYQKKALRIGDPQNAGYIVRYPIYNRNFNLRDYPSVRVVLSDLEALVLWGLQEKCGLQRRDLKVCNKRRTLRSDLTPTTGLFCCSGHS